VFEVFRTGFDQTGTPLRVTVTVWPVGRTQFIVNVGEDLPDPQYGGDEARYAIPAPDRGLVAHV